jgi:hypothetical protein
MCIHSVEEITRFRTFLVVHVKLAKEVRTLYASSVFSVQVKILLAYLETTSQK